MDSSVVTLCIGLATVLTSGVASSVVTYRLNRNKEQTFFMRQKAEALYLAADEYGRGLSAHVITLLPVARGELDYNQMLDLQNANPPSKRDGGFETLSMLVSIYFPEIEPELQALLKARDRLGEVRGAHKQAYKEGEGVDPVWVAGFAQVGKEADQAIKALKAAIVRSARRYAIAPSELKRRIGRVTGGN
jgi:hypothetical protein